MFADAVLTLLAMMVALVLPGSCGCAGVRRRSSRSGRHRRSPWPDHFRPDGSLSGAWIREASRHAGPRHEYRRRCGSRGLSYSTELTAGLPSMGPSARPSVCVDRRTSGGNPRGDAGHNSWGFLAAWLLLSAADPKEPCPAVDPTFHQNGVHAILSRKDDALSVVSMNSTVAARLPDGLARVRRALRPLTGRPGFQRVLPGPHGRG